MKFGNSFCHVVPSNSLKCSFTQFHAGTDSALRRSRVSAQAKKLQRSEQYFASTRPAANVLPQYRHFSL
jgi:hypothetical protein